MDRQEDRRPYWRDEDVDVDVQEFQERHRSFSDRVERLLMQVVILALVALVLVQTLQVIPFIRKHMSVTEALEGISAKELLSWGNWRGDAPSQPSQQAAQKEPAGTERQPVVTAAGTAPAVQAYTVTVVLVSQRSAPRAKLLLDGKAAGTFGENTLTVKVKPGQVITVDGTGSSQALTFRVVGATPGLASPALGASVTTHGDRQRLGAVELAH